jgi:flagellar hook assembly protein FlgD
MRRALLFCAAIAFAIACGDSITEPIPNRTVATPPIAFATTTTEDGLSISTDKDDYQPGDTVHFTGSGWQPGDVLDIVLTDDPLTHDPHTWTVNVEADGMFHDSTYVVDEGDLNVAFTLVATSRATGRSLTVQFTDNLGNIQMSGASPTPFSPNQASSTGINDFITISLQNGSGAANGVLVRIRQGELAPNQATLVKELGPIDFAANAAASLNWDGKDANSNYVADGVYTARVVGTSEGNGTSNKRRIVVDNANPTVAVNAIADGPTGTEITVTGTASDLPAVTGAGLEKVEVSVLSSTNTVLASGNATNTGTNFSTWSFSYTPTNSGAQKGRAKATDNAGNNTTSTDQTFTVADPDQDAPAINCTLPDQDKWWGNNVTVNCTASDVSGLKNPSQATFSLSTSVAANAETATAQTNSVEVCDTHDHCATAGPYTFKVDRKAPAVSCAAADGAWHGSDALVACTAADDGSGLGDAGDAGFNLTTNVAAGVETNNASTNSKSVADAVGNSATAGPVAGNMVDKMAPSFSCPAADGNWHADNVSIACTASDGGSGISPASDVNFSLSTTVADGAETANASTGSKVISDLVGNTKTAGPISGNMIDKKAPAISCNSADGVWHNDNVSIACTASDGGSNLANAGDASFNLTTNVASNNETNDASTGTRSVADVVGNTATAGPVSGNKIDKKAPVVTLTCPSSAITLGAPANATWTATELGSGLVGPNSGTVSLVTGTVGPQTANAPTLQDNVGNSSSLVTCGYSVVYDFRGFFTPVDNPGPNNTMNVANSGQAIPLKWQLLDYAGHPVTNLSSVIVKVENLDCGLTTTVDAIEEYAAGASGLQNLGGGNYQFNWKTLTGYAKSCKTMKLNLGEGSSRIALFQFRK